VFTGDSPYAASPWRREKGALWDVGPHALSVLMPVLGDVERVEAAGRGPGDTVHAVLRHVGGASSAVTLSLTAPVAAAGVSVELRGEAGVVGLPAASEGVVGAFGRAVDAVVGSAEVAPGGRGVACEVGFGVRVTEVLAEVEGVLGVRG
jgi:predicted dehydrogenase